MCRLCVGDSCRMRRIEGVGTTELVYVSGLLRMGGDSLLLPVWRSVGDGSLAKESRICEQSEQVPKRSGNLHGSRMSYLPQLISCRSLTTKSWSHSCFNWKLHPSDKIHHSRQKKTHDKQNIFNVFSNSKEMFLNIEEQLTIPLGTVGTICLGTHNLSKNFLIH